MAIRMDQLQETIDALRVSLIDVTTEVIKLRTPAAASTAAIASLTTVSNTARDGLTFRADQIESGVDDVLWHVRRGGGPGDVSARHERESDLLHKGDFKEFNGDKKRYRP